MSNPTPIAMVIDRPTAAKITAEVDSMGGAWAEMFHAWLLIKSSPYLVMMAHTKERIRQRAPLTAFVIEKDGLRMALESFCQQLDDVACRWCLFVEKGSDAERIIREAVLSDCVMEGHA